MGNELLTKQQIRENMDDWLDGFTNTTRFLNSINWECSFCAQYKKENKKIHKNQQKIIGDNNV